MTDEQIDALDAGPDMDAAVAQAISARFGEGSWWIGEKGSAINLGPASDDRILDSMYADETVDMFSPSTDWNAAMFAAERFGLFTTSEYSGWEAGLLRMKRSPESEWQWNIWSEAIDTVVCSAPTGPLAICRAILKLTNRS